MPSSSWNNKNVRAGLRYSLCALLVLVSMMSLLIWLYGEGLLQNLSDRRLENYWRDQGLYLNLHLSPHEAILSFAGSEAPLSDDVIRQIGEIPNLRIIYFRGSQITPKQMTDICNMNLPLLKSIGVIGPLIGVTDGNDGFQSIGNLGSLEYLILNGIPINDEVFPQFAKLKSLKELSIRDSRISQDGFNRLRDLLPNTTIKTK